MEKLDKHMFGDNNDPENNNAHAESTNNRPVPIKPNTETNQTTEGYTINEVTMSSRKAGNLYKRAEGPIIYEWRRRYLVVDGQTLNYYDSEEKSQGGQPRKSYQLINCKIRDMKQNSMNNVRKWGFVVYFNEDKELHFSGLTVEDNLAWREFITQACNPDRPKHAVQTFITKKQEDKMLCSGISGKPNYFYLFLHLIFEILAIYCYIWLDHIIDCTDAVVFSVCLIFLCLDFWITKNVTGRFLVGLRWWNTTSNDLNECLGIDEVKDENFMSAEIVCEFKAFESKYEGTYDSVIFWWGIYAGIIYWSIIMIIKIFTLNFLWTILSITGALLYAYNGYAFNYCKNVQFNDFEESNTKMEMQKFTVL